MDSSAESFLKGEFAGDGVWRDIAGDTKKYRITTLSFESTGDLLKLRFTHDLYEENDSVVAEFAFRFDEDSRFTVFAAESVGGARLGNGHLIDNYCQYLLVIGNTVVENRMVFVEKGLRIFGSSSRNKNGRFIWWEERLTSVRQTPTQAQGDSPRTPP